MADQSEERDEFGKSSGTSYDSGLGEMESSRKGGSVAAVVMR